MDLLLTILWDLLLALCIVLYPVQSILLLTLIISFVTYTLVNELSTTSILFSIQVILIASFSIVVFLPLLTIDYIKKQR